MATLHEDFLDEIKTRILALSLEGIGAPEVKIVNEPWNSRTVETGIPIWELGETYDSPWGTTNASEDVGYRVGVGMIRPGSDDLKAHIGRIPALRKAIRTEFANKRLTTTAPADASIILSTVHNLPMKLPRKANWVDRTHIIADFLMIICWVRENRNDS